MSQPIAGAWAQQQGLGSGLLGYIPAGQNLGYGTDPIHGISEAIGRPTVSREPLSTVAGAPSGFTPEEYISSEWYDVDYDDGPAREVDYRQPFASGWTDWEDSPDRSQVDYPAPGEDSTAFLAKKNGPEPFGRGTAYGPYPGITGGWIGKQYGPTRAHSQTAATSQVFVNTSDVQVEKEYSQAASGRSQQDDPRASIQPRLVGPREPTWAKDFEQGGGPGTPQMRPVSTDRIPKRPFFSRGAKVPGIWNSGMYSTMRNNEPIGWQPAQDSGAGVPSTPVSDDGADVDDYGTEYYD
jgi:hypothetical protein